jgi:hypothetical protein
MTYRLFFGCDFNGIGHHQRSSLFGDASDLIERADDLQSNHKAITKQPQSNHKAITKQSHIVSEPMRQQQSVKNAYAHTRAFLPSTLAKNVTQLGQRYKQPCTKSAPLTSNAHVKATQSTDTKNNQPTSQTLTQEGSTNDNQRERERERERERAIAPMINALSHNLECHTVNRNFVFQVGEALVELL